MKHKVTLTGDICLIKQKKVKKTKSGIILELSTAAGGSMEEANGKILAVGPEVKRFDVGDIVFWNIALSTYKKYGNDEYCLVNSRCLTLRESLVEDDYIPTKHEYIVGEGIDGDDLMAITRVAGGYM